ncbi:MAG: hypothetical protein WCN87_01120 [Chlamydiota bacterium]
MKWFKRAALSLSLLITLTGLIGISEAINSTKEPAPIQLAKQGLELNQTKVNIHRSYWFFDKERPISNKMFYHSSHIFRDNSRIEENKDLEAEAFDNISLNTFFAETGSLNYGTNILEAEKVHITRQIKDQPFLKALADTITVHLKESSPTFEATGVKAEVES